MSLCFMVFIMSLPCLFPLLRPPLLLLLLLARTPSTPRLLLLALLPFITHLPLAQVSLLLLAPLPSLTALFRLLHSPRLLLLALPPSMTPLPLRPTKSLPTPANKQCLLTQHRQNRSGKGGRRLRQ
ncbi:MAG: hypothetical protein EOM68_18840 [Spirochaetia bacterium]|nr:hypothetical protein [Spirochaetia bacterium]